jgi:hypothetical protein
MAFNFFIGSLHASVFDHKFCFRFTGFLLLWDQIANQISRHCGLSVRLMPGGLLQWAEKGAPCRGQGTG